jgi:hypothetical protein
MSNDAAAALAELRRLYFKATRSSIAQDFERAIDLIKSLPTDEDREKATVYMQGLAEMRKEWGMRRKPGRH